MAVHPVTPMSELSLRLNLLAQAEGLTVREVHLLDLRRAGGDRVATWGGEAMPQRVTVFDALANDDLETIADLILAEAPRGGPALCVGSGGMSYGIAVFLARRTSASARRSPPMPPVGAMLVVSGSCSRLTAEQIERAVEHGWRGVRVDPARLAHADALAEQQESVVASLSAGQSVVAYTASGTSDTPDADVAVIGAGLARIVEASLKRAGVRRLIVAGGDTSGYVVRALPVRAQAGRGRHRKRGDVHDDVCRAVARWRRGDAKGRAGRRPRSVRAGAAGPVGRGEGVTSRRPPRSQGWRWGSFRPGRSGH